MFAQQRHGRHPGFAQEIERAGQQHRHGPCTRHRGGALLAEPFQMVAAERAIARRQRRAAAVAELFGMELDRQAEAARGLEHTLGLGRAEGDALAERVHGIDQALLVQQRQHAQHFLDVLVRPPAEFRRQGMGAQEGGAHVAPVARAPIARAACSILRSCSSARP